MQICQVFKKCRIISLEMVVRNYCYETIDVNS